MLGDDSWTVSSWGDENVIELIHGGIYAIHNVLKFSEFYMLIGWGIWHMSISTKLLFSGQ